MESWNPKNKMEAANIKGKLSPIGEGLFSWSNARHLLYI